MSDQRKTVAIPQNLSPGETVRFLMELEPEFESAEDEADWRKFAAPQRCVDYKGLEIRRTPSGYTVKILNSELELPVASVGEMVAVVNGLLVDTR